MATKNVSLPYQMKDWIEEQSRSGSYANSSDYVRGQTRAATIAELQSAIDTALASGPAQALTAEEFKATMTGRQ